MAREIVVAWGGREHRFGLERITREKIYGTKKRVVVDADGQNCTSALMTSDGAHLIPNSGLSQIYVTEDFNTIDRGDLQAIDPYSGQPLNKLPSTLGVPQELEGPVPLEDYLDHACGAVYALDPAELGDDLRAQLEQGAIYRAAFNYRSGYQGSTLFVLCNAQGFFGVIGELVPFNYCEPDDAPPAPEIDDFLDDDDLDFEMF